ncbi:hypothetical protein L3V86_00325 [Thiotrichales bacterium 19S11-10]|nr:hypothetical protein [Thiotrichales bacterium 19S11-10]
MGNMHYKMLSNTIGDKYTKNICSYLEKQGKDRVLIPHKFRKNSHLSDLLPEEIYKKLVSELGGMRLKPIEITETDRIRITKKAVSILQQELTEDEIALVLQRSARTVRYAYRDRRMPSQVANSDCENRQMSLFDYSEECL